MDCSPEVVHLELLRMAWAIKATSRRVPLVLDMHNVESQRARSEQSQKQLSFRHRVLAVWEYLRLRRFETWACRSASWVVAVTPQDAEALRGMARHDRVTYVPVGVDTDYFQPFRASSDTTIVFAGSMSYHPNIDAMLHFYRQILPLIAARIPNLKVLIVGRDPAPEIWALSHDPRVEVTGTVSDVRPYFARSAVCVIPVRIGGGVKQKLLEAMAMGMPVVTTSFSCIGIPIKPEVHVLVRDDPESLADGAAMLLKDQERRRQVGEAAASFVRRHYSWERSVALLEDVYERAIEAHVNGRQTRANQRWLG